MIRSCKIPLGSKLLDPLLCVSRLDVSSGLVDKHLNTVENPVESVPCRGARGSGLPFR